MSLNVIKKPLTSLPGFNKTLNFILDHSTPLMQLANDCEMRIAEFGGVFILKLYADDNGFDIFYPETSQDLEIVKKKFIFFNTNEPNDEKI